MWSMDIPEEQARYIGGIRRRNPRYTRSTKMVHWELIILNDVVHMATTKLNIKPRKMKRYGTTASRSHYGTLDKARASAYAEMMRVKDKPMNTKVITIYDANIGSGDRPTIENIVGYVQFYWFG